MWGTISPCKSVSQKQVVLVKFNIQDGLTRLVLLTIYSYIGTLINTLKSYFSNPLGQPIF